MFPRMNRNGYAKFTNRNIQIIGAISGVPDYKYRFERAEIYLLSKGNKVWNPVKEVDENLSYKEQMKLCLDNLQIVDSIYALNNWAVSDGARAEYFTSLSYKLDVYFERFYSDFIVERMKQYIADEFNHLGVVNYATNRKKEVVAFKAAVCHLLYREYGLTIEQIGEVMSLDNSTIANQLKNVNQSIKNYKTNKIKDDVVKMIDYHLIILNQYLGGYYGAEV